MGENLKKIYKRVGLMNDNRGIYRRYLCEADHWQSHLNRCKGYIIHAVSEKTATHICILGSGWLLDVPVKFLLEKAKIVHLIDIVHPPEILHKYKKEPKFNFIQADVTGGLVKEVYHLIKSKKINKEKGLQDIQINKPDVVPSETDLVISLNLLSQVNGLLVEYIKLKTNVTKNSISSFSAQIQQQHLDILPKGKSCLISDTSEIITDINDNFIKENPLLYIKLPELNQKKQWIWDFDTSGTYYPNCKTQMKVIAVGL